MAAVTFPDCCLQPDWQGGPCCAAAYCAREGHDLTVGPGRQPADDGRCNLCLQPAFGPCATCREPFTGQEWEVRHSREDGEDVHERCCTGKDCATHAHEAA